MEKQRYCVYNQNSESFLSLKVIAADTMFARLRGLIGKLRFRADEGLWIVPSKGTHTIGALSPADLIYLNEKQRVVHLVESLPTFHFGPLRADTATVLALRPHSIYSSQTQVGDQMVICVAADMARCMESPGETPRAPRDTKPARVLPASAPAKGRKEPSNWWQKLFSKDRRRAKRHLSPQLVAYYWNCGMPTAHGIRDISSSGFYLLTEDRWYPGTMVRVTLQSAENLEESLDQSRDSIIVQTVVLRRGKDGVGLAFLLLDEDDSPRGGKIKDSATRQAMDKFLKPYLKSKEIE